VDLLRPRWNHANCGGIIAGSEALFKCCKCEKAAPAIGAVLPSGTWNEPEYFACHSELIVELLSAEYAAAQQRSNPKSKMENDFLNAWRARQIIASSSADRAQARRAASS